MMSPGGKGADLAALGAEMLAILADTAREARKRPRGHQAAVTAARAVLDYVCWREEHPERTAPPQRPRYTQSAREMLARVEGALPELRAAAAAEEAQAAEGAGQ